MELYQVTFKARKTETVLNERPEPRSLGDMLLGASHYDRRELCVIANSMMSAANAADKQVRDGEWVDSVTKSDVQVIVVY